MRISGVLGGSVTPPPSKSQAHRLLICAALAKNPSQIRCAALNDDIEATVRCLNALGADIRYADGLFDVRPVELKRGGLLDCGESGSTYRFMLPIAAALGADVQMTGSGKLPKRPMDDLFSALRSHGVTIETPGEGLSLPLHCTGRLCGGEYFLPGNISSQYLTGLLFALPMVEDDSIIHITGELTSASYVEMTLDALRRSGVEIKRDKNDFYIKGGTPYEASSAKVEGDWSAAAFWLTAGVVGANPVTCKGMNVESCQGDRRIIDALRALGARIEVGEEGITAYPSQLHGAELDCSDIPDLVPILSVAASSARGTTTFTRVGRLRYKESDRLQAVESLLSKFGIASASAEDTFTVIGGRAHAADGVDSFGDHRIAMSAAVLASTLQDVSILFGAESVKKSYPMFFFDFAALGGNIH